MTTFVAAQSGVLVPSSLKPDTGPVAGEDTFAGRSFALTTTPADGLTPAKLIALLKGATGGSIVDQAKLFEAMEEGDPGIGAHMATRRSAVLAEGYQVLPDPEADDEAMATRVCDFTIAAIRTLDTQARESGTDPGVRLRGGFRDALVQKLDAVGKAFSVLEPVWATSERQWWWDHWEVRPQRWFTIRGDELQLRGQSNEGRRLNPYNLWVHIHRARPGTVQSSGLFRQLARPFVISNYALKDFLAFSELFGVPMRLGYFDPLAGKEAKAALWRALYQLATDACAMLPEGTRIEFPETRSSSTPGLQTVHEKLLDRCRDWKALIILGQLSTVEQGGSYAKALALQAVRYDLRDDDARRLEDSVRHQMFAPLVRLNFGPAAPVPVLQIERSAPKDIETLSKVYCELADRGMGISLRQLRDDFGLREPVDDEPVLKPKAAPSPVGGLAATAELIAADAAGLKKNGRARHRCYAG